MRHRVGGFKLGRDSEHRTSLLRNLATALFTHGQITTTIPKAKSVKPFVEKLITLARRGDLASRRRVLALLRDRIMVTHDDDDNVKRNKYGEVVSGPKVVKKLFDEIGPKYKDREGGYTRIVKLAQHRIGDGGQLCVLQLVGDEEGPQLGGQKSRRREMCNHRMEFAAKLRKSKGDEAKPAAAEETAAATAEEAAAESADAPDAGEEKRDE
jgi:large subunit ribosomal protein L17